MLLVLAFVALTPALAADRSPSTAKSAQPSSAHRAGARKGHAAHGKKTSARGRKGAWKRRGQQGIQPERATQIQQALVQAHYWEGEPSGKWDAKTEEALRRYQADNGWQTKIVPDSRAIIKLGLGPSNDGLINPETAATATAATATAAQIVPGGTIGTITGAHKN
jgi:peptidoglycan hydrolase-like protein with peptidoglycan-binding domain